jgi:hypothetical protein
VVTFGIEGISRYDDARKNVKGWEKLEDFRPGFVFEVCDDLDKGLRKYGHTRKFNFREKGCSEQDIRDITFKGADYHWADDVDLFFISTHGGNDKGIIGLTYNNKEWESDSRKWKLGDKKLKWLMMHACDTLNFDHIRALLPIFQKLHEICGAYDTMYTGPTTDENGEDIADNLTKNDKTVADAWIDGVDDWAYDNHPVIVAAENSDSVNVATGRSDWKYTTMARDRIKEPVPDIPNSDIYWLSIKWKQGSDIKQRRSQIV